MNAVESAVTLDSYAWQHSDAYLTGRLFYKIADAPVVARPGHTGQGFLPMGNRRIARIGGLADCSHSCGRSGGYCPAARREVEQPVGLADQRVAQDEVHRLIEGGVYLG